MTRRVAPALLPPALLVPALLILLMLGPLPVQASDDAAEVEDDPAHPANISAPLRPDPELNGPDLSLPALPPGSAGLPTEVLLRLRAALVKQAPPRSDTGPAAAPAATDGADHGH